MPTPGIADPATPLYYLENAHTLINSVLEYHSDLLSPQELKRLQEFKSLPQPCQALLVRLVMRTHNEFKMRDLSYPEIGQPLNQLVNLLAERQWVELNPPLDVSALGRLLRKKELLEAFDDDIANLGLTGKATKKTLLSALTELYRDQRKAITDWWPNGTEQILAFRENPLFRRLRLMFFGNLRQDWSQFVVTALGYQRYEPVALSAESRAFQTRRDVDLYLELYDCRDSLNEETDLSNLWQRIPEVPKDNPWLTQRRNRLIHSLGHLAEKQGQTELAVEAYRASWSSESRIRYFRLREKQGPEQALLREVEQAITDAQGLSEAESLDRIRRRLSKKLNSQINSNNVTPTDAGIKAPTGINPGTAETTGRISPTAIRPAISKFELTLTPDPHCSVERLAAKALSRDKSRCFYVENSLFNSLLGLVCWPAVFAPIPGAFFNPFQAGPADLLRDSFGISRRTLLDSCLNALDSEDYQARIIDTWRCKFGTTNILVNWSLLSEGLLQYALSCISPDHLKAIFQRQLDDLASLRKGFPDLVRFWPESQRYELIEVKAPGDRLQDHQRHWFSFFESNSIPARLCHIRWQESP